MKSWRSLIPNLLTLANLGCGLLALDAIFLGAYVPATWFIVASLCFDFLDGFAARILKVSSELGKQLDSLADLVSFGLTPGFLMYYQISEYDQEGQMWLAYTALAIPIFSAWRLAVFNIDDRQTSYFLGLPTPANTMWIFAIALYPLYGSFMSIQEFLTQPLVLALISLVSAILLVTPFPLQSLKFKNWYFGENVGRYLLIVGTLLLLSILGLDSLLFIIPLYLLISIIFKPQTE